MNAVAPLRRVAVIGGGVVAATAALAFARALPGAEVVLIPAPVPADALADRSPMVWPSANPIFARLGVEEATLLARGVAVPILGRAFRDWGTARWLCPEGTATALAGAGPLHARWLRAGHQAGAFHALFPAAALAEAGAVTPALLARPDLDGADMALALSPERWLAVLREGCRQRGVRVAAAPVAQVERGADGGWAGVTLADGATLRADLFVWAAGRLPDDAWQSWAATLPSDRVALTPAEGAPALLDAYRATDAGWEAEWSTPDGRTRARAWSAESEVADGIALRPGRTARAWTGNLLRLGEAAAQFGALGRAGYTFAAHQLLLLLELLPGRAIDPVLSAEYDRRLALRAERLHDLLAAHYVAGTRRRGAFWRRIAAPAAGSSLATTLVQFRRRGALPHFDEESVPADAWRAVLLGQGVRPEVPDPTVRGADPAALAATLAAAAERLRRAALG